MQNKKNQQLLQEQILANLSFLNKIIMEKAATVIKNKPNQFIGQKSIHRTGNFRGISHCGCRSRSISQIQSVYNLSTNQKVELRITQKLLTEFFCKTRQKQSIREKIEAQSQEFDSKQYQELKNQQLARVIKFFGQQKFKKLQDSFVVVFGVGGVGSHVVNMLGRSGVGKIRIVDFDQVTLSSLNRHSCAVRDDVGTSKVKCLQKFMNRVFPHLQIQTVQTYVTLENARSLLPEKVDYVVDCIDNLDAKAELIQACLQKNIRLIVSGGAGMKNDPTRLQIRDIADCKYDNLILRLKRELSKKGIKKGVKVVYSYQQAQKQLLPLNKEQQEKPEAFKVFDNYRIRIVPVLGTMPAIIGMTIASYVLCQLAEEPYEPFETDYVKAAAFNKIFNELINDEKKNGCNITDLKVDMEEVCLLSKYIFKWECFKSKKKENSLKLIRWNPDKPADVDNLVLLGRQAYEKHKRCKSLLEVEQYFGKEEVLQFQKLAKQARNRIKTGGLFFI